MRRMRAPSREKPPNGALYLPHELMGFAEGTGLLWFAGMSNGVRFFAPLYWKIAPCAKRAAKNPYYEG
jgi:hypothetical protein